MILYLIFLEEYPIIIYKLALLVSDWALQNKFSHTDLSKFASMLPHYFTFFKVVVCHCHGDVLLFLLGIS